MTSILLTTPDNRRRAIEAIRTASPDTEVTLRPKRKSREQEKLFHARLTEFAKSDAIRARWGCHTIDEWKDEMVKATFGLEIRHSILNPEQVVSSRLSTTRLSVQGYADLIENLMAIGAEAGHVWTEYRPGDPHFEAQQEYAKRAA